MAHVNKVMRSINNSNTTVCVDIFLRPDGTLGFEEYRRDIEDGRGWFPVGGYSSHIFQDQDAALAAAKAKVRWLRDALGE